MRDKIADKLLEIAIDAPQSISRHELALTQADVIIAALPDMVQPLEWDKHPDEQEWYAILPEIEGQTFESGYMILPKRTHFTLYDGFSGRARVLGQFTLADEAKAAANKHHADQLMKGLGL